jgi:hypothetical protein
MGSFTDGWKRNIKSFINAMDVLQICFLGGQSDRSSADKLQVFVNTSLKASREKIELLPNLDSYEFMKAVGHVDVILPLVDETNFYCGGKCYQNGSKLTSAVSWTLGFDKKMVIYRPLAQLFGIPDD